MCSNPPFYLLEGAIPAIIPELFDGFNKILAYSEAPKIWVKLRAS